MERNQFREFLCKVRPLSGHPAAKCVLWQHGMPQMINLKRLPKGLAIGADAAYRRAPVIHTVVTLLPANKTRFGWLTLQTPVGPRHLERGVSRLRARVGEERIVQITRHELPQLIGQPESCGMTKLKRRGEIQLIDLISDGF